MARHRTSRLVAVVLAVALLVLVAGCTTDSGPDVTPGERDTSPESSPIGSPLPETERPPEDTQPSGVSTTLPGEDSHFGFMHPEDAYGEAADLGARWSRPHPGAFIWGEVEREPGQYDWSRTDRAVKEAQGHGFNLIVTLWPYAEWDQSRCRTPLPEDRAREFRELGRYRGPPCDLEAYREFVRRAVERYDGDGVDDMPGLKYPVRYWEVSNEPSMQEELTFFTGTPPDYFEILRATHGAVEAADPDATVVQGGAASAEHETADFWEEVYDLGGAQYFDIANVHSIGLESYDLYASKYATFLDENDVEKPFWVTEAQYSARALGRDRLSPEEWADYITKSFVRAYAAGAQKIVYVGLTKSPGDLETSLLLRGEKQVPYHAYGTMVEKLDEFTAVEKLEEGAYKFTVEGREVYVLWGSSEAPAELSGPVTVTEVDGTETETTAEELELGEGPVFVEGR